MVGSAGINAAEVGLNSSCRSWPSPPDTTANILPKETLHKQLPKETLHKQTAFLLLDYLEGATDPWKTQLMPRTVDSSLFSQGSLGYPLQG